MKKNLYESVLQAITEIDLNEASAEDFLRIGISAEEGAINLYNRIAKELEKRSEKGLFELFKSIAQEEKVHVGEFQGYLEETDHEEKYSSNMGRDEAEEIMELDLLEDLVINQKDKRIILEKGDRIKIIESLYLERDDNWLVSRKFDFIKFDPKRATARIYIDDITFFQIDLIYIYSDEFEVYDDIPEQTFYRLTLGQKTPIGGGLTLKSNFNAYLGNLFSEDGQELFDLINRYIIKNRKIIGKLGQQHEDEISDYFRRKGPIDATDHYEGKGIL
jgi:rubrerythrin